MQEQKGQASLPSGAESLKADDPAQIGAYKLIGRLGEGGMGTVYLGRAQDGRLVAVKMIRAELAADHTFRARFRDEVTNAQRVASFCTAQVIGHGEENGRPYLATEYVDGRPLDEYTEAQGALPPGTLHGVAVGVAAALTAIHAAELIHRDLKPSNVMLSVSGPRVIDFGIARATDSSAQHTQTGFVVGSPGWMAPEQVMRGETTTAVDIFAWGTLVAFAGTGRHPYGKGTLITMAARAQSHQPDLDGLPDELRRLVMRALNPEPERRPTAQQLLLALVGGAEQVSAGKDAQMVAGQELDRTWVAEALPPDLVPPPWVPPSPPRGVPISTPPTYGPPPVPAHQSHQPPPPVPSVPPPPAMPPTAPRYPAAQRQRPQRRTGCLTGSIVTAVIVIAGLAFLGYLVEPTNGRLGQPAKDGQFTFVVQSGVRCGREAAITGITPRRGKLCQIRFKVTNTGTKGRVLRAGNQLLVDADDNSEDANALLQYTARAKNKVAPQLLSPGDDFSGVLVFDVPTDFQPISVELHDNDISNGVRIDAS